MATVASLTATIPGREDRFLQALESINAQTRPVDQIVVESDFHRTGAACARNRALQRVTSDYVAFLDDDDEWLPNHVESLMKVAETDPSIDVVYPVPEFRGRHKPSSIRVRLGGRFVPPWGLEFTEEHRQYLIQTNNFIPVTALVKTEAIRSVGGFPEPGDSDARLSIAEDWLMFRRLAMKGCKFHHLDEVTWIWERGNWHTEGRGK